MSSHKSDRCHDFLYSLLSEPEKKKNEEQKPQITSRISAHQARSCEYSAHAANLPGTTEQPGPEQPTPRPSPVWQVGVMEVHRPLRSRRPKGGLGSHAPPGALSADETHLFGKGENEYHTERERRGGGEEMGVPFSFWEPSARCACMYRRCVHVSGRCICLVQAHHPPTHRRRHHLPALPSGQASCGP